MSDDTAIIDVIDQAVRDPADWFSTANAERILAALRAMPGDLKAAVFPELADTIRLGQAVETLHAQQGNVTFAEIFAEAGVEQP